MTNGTDTYQEGLGNALRQSNGANSSGDSKEKTIANYLGKLRLLQGIPFHYLVPDERMLPVESIRFFQIDPNWITSLIDGAFSIGRSTSGDNVSGQEATLTGKMLNVSRAAAQSMRARLLDEAVGDSDASEAMSGFLIRSGVVAGWPHIEVLGFADLAEKQPLKLLRFEKLTSNVKICIFQGTVAKIRLKEPSEVMHFGVEALDSNATNYKKPLRYVTANGDNAVGAQMSEASVPVTFRAGDQRVVNISSLATAVKNELISQKGMDAKHAYTPAEFALQLIEGVQEVDFTISNPKA